MAARKKVTKKKAVKKTTASRKKISSKNKKIHTFTPMKVPVKRTPSTLKRINLVLKNLILFTILFAISFVLYDASTEPFYVDFFLLLSFLFIFVILAFLIVLLALFFVRLFKR